MEFRHPSIAPELLGDYLDDRLDPETRRAVEDAIRAHPDLAAHVAALRLQEAQLRRLGREVIDEPIPERLQEVLRRLRFGTGA